MKTLRKSLRGKRLKIGQDENFILTFPRKNLKTLQDYFQTICITTEYKIIIRILDILNFLDPHPLLFVVDPVSVPEQYPPLIMAEY
jgi:hypothetical protein